MCRICRPFEYFCETRQLHLQPFVLHELFPIDEKIMPLFDNVISEPTAKIVDSSVKSSVPRKPIEQKPPVQQKAISTSVLDAVIADGKCFNLYRTKLWLILRFIGIERGVSKAMRFNTNCSVRSPAFHRHKGRPNHLKMGRGLQTNRKLGKLKFQFQILHLFLTYFSNANNVCIGVDRVAASKGNFKTEHKDGLFS